MREYLPIFVYGTLQRGEVRGRQWPRPPQQIEWAMMRGRLHDLGPYPALVEGNELVLGELWEIALQDLAATLARLDEMEGYGQGDEDLYLRRIAECRTLAGEVKRAFVYVYAKPEGIAASPVVMPDRDGVCHWQQDNKRSR